MPRCHISLLKRLMIRQQNFGNWVYWRITFLKSCSFSCSMFNQDTIALCRRDCKSSILLRCRYHVWQWHSRVFWVMYPTTEWFKCYTWKQLCHTWFCQQNSLIFLRTRTYQSQLELTPKGNMTASYWKLWLCCCFELSSPSDSSSHATRFHPQKTVSCALCLMSCLSNTKWTQPC